MRVVKPARPARLGRTVQGWRRVWVAAFLGLCALGVTWLDRLLSDPPRRVMAVLDPLVDASPVGIALLDVELRFVRVNPALTRQSRLPPDAHQGGRLDEAIPDLPAEFHHQLRAVLAMGAALRQELVTTQPPDLSPRQLMIDAFPVRPPGRQDGPITGVGVVVTDVTDQHRLLTSFQQALLPAELPTIPGATLVAEYNAVADRMEIGGDWYDAFALPDGRIALSIGDVIGHDLQAAAIMGQVRAVTRSYALEDPDPGSVLTRLNRLLPLAYPCGTLVSAVAGLYDPTTGRLQWANAGHPHPLLAHPAAGNATVAVLDHAHPILGVLGDTTYPTHQVTLSDHGTLLCYTDGLIEHHTRDPRIGEAMLHAVLTEALAGPRPMPAKKIIYRLRTVMHASGPPEDDVCVLILQRDPNPEYQIAPRRSRG